MLFPSETVDILKLDFVFEAGSAYQSQPLCASSTASLMPAATSRYNPQQLADFLDRRGVLLDTSTDIHCATLTAYLLPKYAAETFPLLREILTAPVFPEEEVASHCRRMRQRLVNNFQRTSYVAHNLFRHALYGPVRPEGRFARPEDADALSASVLQTHFREHFRLDQALLSLAGHYDDKTLDLFRSHFGDPAKHYIQPSTLKTLQPSNPQTLKLSNPPRHIRQNLDTVLDSESPILNSQLSTLNSPRPQASIRVGCILPFDARHDDYAPFSVLGTVLGGYFGSRLMRNIREEKGYTYGIYCRTRLYRSSICFEVVSDVASDNVEQTLSEVYGEMERLGREPLADDELELVRHYMEGDYMRSIDGVFERADRWLQLTELGLDEPTFSERLLHAIQHTTAGQLQQLARRYLVRDAMTEVVVF